MHTGGAWLQTTLSDAIDVAQRCAVLSLVGNDGREDAQMALEGKVIAKLSGTTSTTNMG